MATVDRNRPRRGSASDSTYSIMELHRDFPDDAACLDWLWRHLYSADGEMAQCPKCNRLRRFHRVRSRPSYSCDVCGHHLHPTAGTIFHKSPTSLALWFHGVYLMSSTRCGVSAKQLERELGVTYKTAWRMFNRIRRLLMEDQPPLSGSVEVDETLIGGKRRYRRGEQAPRNPDGSLKRGRRSKVDENKVPVLAMVERGGRVWTEVIPDVKAATVLPHVRAHVLPDSMIYTDELSTYNTLRRKGYQHKRVHHAAKVYVSGDAHTNTSEGFFSLLKRGIAGTYHAVSAKYLASYVGEYAFRYSHRQDERPMFTTLLGRVRAGQDRLLGDGSPS